MNRVFERGQQPEVGSWPVKSHSGIINKDNGEVFKRKWTFINTAYLDMDEVLFMEYRGDAPDDPRPHGRCINPESEPGFVSTLPSRREHLFSNVRDGRVADGSRGKRLRHLAEIFTDTVNSQSGDDDQIRPGDLRNRRQAYYAQHRVDALDMDRRFKPYGNVAEQLRAAMGMMPHFGSLQEEDAIEKVYGFDNLAPEVNQIPLSNSVTFVILARQQVEWAVQQSLNKKTKTILQVDPTYNLANAYVTTVSMPMEVLKSKNQQGVKPGRVRNPTLILAFMIHTIRDEEAYRHLFHVVDKWARVSSKTSKILSQVEISPPHMQPEDLVGEVREEPMLDEDGNEPQLYQQDGLYFGTDQEPALIAGLKAAVPEARLLLCTSHLSEGLFRKANECRILAHDRAAIFTTVRHMMTEPDEAYQEKYDMLMTALEQDDDEETRRRKTTFARYLAKWLDHMNRFCRQPHLESVERGEPSAVVPIDFNTNVAESVNALLKKECDYKVQSMHNLVRIICKLQERQRKDVTQALTNRGPYRINTGLPNSISSIRASDWNGMTQEQRDLKFRLLFRGVNKNSNTANWISTADGQFRVAAVGGPRRKDGQRYAGQQSKTRPRR